MIVSRKYLSLLTASLAVIAILLVNLASPSPLEQRQDQRNDSLAPTNATMTATTLNLLTSVTYKTTATYSSPTTTTTKTTSRSKVGSFSLPTGESDSKAASSPLSGLLATFCGKFVQQCYKTALHEQTGEISVAHSCERNDGRHSNSFTYSCARGKENLTAKVLKALGKEYHSPSTSTVEDFRIVTEIVEDVETVVDTTTKHIVLTDSTVTTSSWTNVVNIDVLTIPSTVSSTTVVPYTVTSTSMSTLTTVTTSTSGASTATETEVFIGSGQIPVLQVVVPEIEEGVQRRAPSTFCLAYKIACQNECGRVSSRVKTWICDASSSPRYTLACLCRNGKKETQHALAAVAEDRKLVSVTSFGTSTIRLTSTRTTTRLAEVTNVEHTTLTRLLDLTSTSLTSTTTTVGETTIYTGVSSAASTEVTAKPTTTTSTTTTTMQQIRTTTNLVLAATGYVRAFDTTTGQDLGAVRRTESLVYVALGEPEEPMSKFMAIRDEPTGLYKLSVVGIPVYGLFVYGIRSEPVVQSGTSYFASLAYGPFSNCGASGDAAGPVSPNGAACEAFVFNPLALDSTPGATPSTVNFRPFWINPLGSSPPNISSFWVSAAAVDYTLLQVADKEVFSGSFTGTNYWLTLRFPFSS